MLAGRMNENKGNDLTELILYGVYGIKKAANKTSNRKRNFYTERKIDKRDYETVITDGELLLTGLAIGFTLYYIINRYTKQNGTESKPNRSKDGEYVQGNEENVKNKSKYRSRRFK